jgi:hypothetical protein
MDARDIRGIAEAGRANADDVGGSDGINSGQ